MAPALTRCLRGGLVGAPILALIAVLPLPARAAPGADSERRASALLLQERPTRVDRAAAESIVGEYVLRWRAPARVISTRPDRVLIDLGDALGILRPSPDPVAAWITDKAARASWQWAPATTVARRHRAHVQIEVRSPRGDGVANARRLTHLVGAVIAAQPALAVLWSDAGMLLSPARFLTDAEALGRDGIPIGLWLNVLPAALSPHLPVMHTIGLGPLGFRELILFGHRAGPEEALDTLMQVAERVLQARLTLRPGDTLRTNDRQTLVVEEIPAPWNAEEVALQLTPRAGAPPGRRR
jgi:hypothetical protein